MVSSEDWFHPRCAAPWPLDAASAGDLLIFLGLCEATESKEGLMSTGTQQFEVDSAQLLPWLADWPSIYII